MRSLDPVMRSSDLVLTMVSPSSVFVFHLVRGRDLVVDPRTAMELTAPRRMEVNYQWRRLWRSGESCPVHGVGGACKGGVGVVGSGQEKGREHFWAMKIPKSSSWGWRKILQLRSLAQKHVSWTIGDETSISFWFDSWSAVGPLYLKVTNSFIYNTRIPRNAMQGQFIRDGVLLLPQTVLNLFHGQSLPAVQQGSDVIYWGRDMMQTFTTRAAWQLLRPSSHKVLWHHLIWFKGCIP
ncbi:hypothetical protein Droror1_Dr00002384 [Drosera rotundifolia]